MPILDNEKVWARSTVLGKGALACTIEYSPEMREDAFGVFSEVLKQSSIEKFEVNKGAIQKFLRQVHPLVSTKFSSGRYSSNAFPNILVIVLDIRDSVSRLHLCFAVGSKDELVVDVALDPNLDERQISSLRAKLEQLFKRSVTSCNAFLGTNANNE